MTQRNVEQFLGRLATDPHLRRAFGRDGAAALQAFRDEGHELSAVEADALAQLAPSAVEAFAGTLDARIQRADLQAAHVEED